MSPDPGSALSSPRRRSAASRSVRSFRRWRPYALFLWFLERGQVPVRVGLVEASEAKQAGPAESGWLAGFVASRHDRAPTGCSSLTIVPALSAVATMTARRAWCRAASRATSSGGPAATVWDVP
jgi:hypothetical protein